jgi:hypothetical protein
MQREIAAQSVAAIATVGVVVNALELLVAREKLLSFHDWTALRTKYRLSPDEGPGRLEWSISSGNGFKTAVALQAVAAICLTIFFDSGAWAVGLCGYVLAVRLLLGLRLHGFDGSDQMHTIIWSGLLLFLASASDSLKDLALGFIAAQLILAYVTSGIAKLLSPLWRSGNAVGLIVRTESYGNEAASGLIQRLRLSAPLSWATMVLEIVGPFSALMGPRATMGFILSGVAFHLGNAIVMGLNSFVWSFIACFPAVYYVSERWAPF